jgi:ABC-2 type transport system ATP-binding protein
VIRQALIELDQASKRFGSRVALDEFSLSVEEGSVVGLLGPNGAGKTTVIGLASGLSSPRSGQVRWRGRRVGAPFPPAVRRKVGLVTQETALYDELTVRENLRYAAALYGVRERDARIAEVLELVGLSGREKDRAGSLSGGMQRRLAVGRALVHDPDFLIFDEPTLGVDVEARHALWGHVRDLRRKGKTILISTNQLDEAEALCDRVVILRGGRKVSEGEPSALLARGGRYVEIDCRNGDAVALRDQIARMPGVTRIDAGEVALTVHVAGGSPAEAVAALGTGRGASVRVRAPDMVEMFEALAAEANGHR